LIVRVFAVAPLILKRASASRPSGERSSAEPGRSGPLEEIADAVRSFVKMQAQQGASLSDVIDRVTPEAIACHLYAADLPDPDLIIRTSSEIRLSGFLLWQSVHGEFYFTDVLWPAFRKVDFLRAIRAYQARNRRFGR
jgi:short-chain Z-isoprenyl diphosphate synthase